MITKKLKTAGLLTAAVFLFSACSTASIMESNYPDRNKFSFETGDGTKYQYLCEDKSQKHAKRAHDYVISKSGDIATEAMGDMLKKSKSKDEDDRPSFMSFMWTSLSASIKMSDGGKKMSKDVEEKFKCVIIDVED